MRSPEETSALIAWIPQSYYTEESIGGRQYIAGVVDGLRWVLGQRQQAPITGRETEPPVTRATVAQEAYAAAEAISDGGASIRRPVERRYATGAEHALTWVTGSASFALPDNWQWPE
ncbi:hypothetical protein [Salinispora mooreana]|uniref:hypothetical protein n=1 Tax=Salinispora mooreana TaxID=999545 RepID=UPI00036EB2E2|nr:hypothetical protein [Salinispora mooreana]